VHSSELAKKIENAVTLQLIGARWHSPVNYTIRRLFVYDFILKEYSKYGIITAGFFNRIIDDLKKAGIVTTAKGGEVLFVSDAYWQLSGNEDRFNAFIDQRERLTLWIMSEVERSPRTADYFYSDSEHDRRLVDDVLKLLCDTDGLKLEDGMYHLSDSTCAAVDAEKKEQVGGGN
jgi:hypothetical protein